MRPAPALVCLALLAGLGCIHHPDPTPADLDATITRADFADWLASYALETKHEKLGKTEKGGIVILEYAWLGDDGELAIGVGSTVYWTRTPAEAAAAYRKLLEAKRDRAGVAWRPVHVSTPWAEDAKAYVLLRADREIVGHLFFAWRGNVALRVSLTGMHSEEAWRFAKKLEPELWKLSEHVPGPR
jgi:hypothetical protein